MRVLLLPAPIPPEVDEEQQQQGIFQPPQAEFCQQQQFTL